MNHDLLAKRILGFTIIASVIIVAVADVFNRTHLFNPDWPSHARFHIGMQFTTLLLVSVFSLAALRGPLDRAKAMTAALAPVTFWLGLPVAWLIPGTDVYATDELRQLGMPINIVLSAVFFAIAMLGVRLAGGPRRQNSSASRADRD